MITVILPSLGTLDVIAVAITFGSSPVPLSTPPPLRNDLLSPLICCQYRHLVNRPGTLNLNTDDDDKLLVTSATTYFTSMVHRRHRCRHPYVRNMSSSIPSPTPPAPFLKHYRCHHRHYYHWFNIRAAFNLLVDLFCRFPVIKTLLLLVITTGNWPLRENHNHHQSYVAASKPDVIFSLLPSPEDPNKS